MTEVHVHGAQATVRSPGLEDEVAVEEPLESRVDGAPLAVTMRTPGNDEELSFELVQKSAVAGVARNGRVHVYTGAERVR